MAHGLAGSLVPLTAAREAFVHYWETRGTAEVSGVDPEPRRFLMLSTSRGFVNLSDEATIEEYMEKETSLGRKCTGLRKLGGVLNNVYLIEFHPNAAFRGVVAKKFEQWVNMKWGTLALWAVGAQNFSVRAKTRMARECSALRFLRQNHILVPEVLHVSWDRAILFLEYVEGRSLDTYVAEWLKRGEVADDDAAHMKKAGETLARVHSLNMSVGDFKPENLIVTSNGSLCLVDLEQSGKDGNKPWDLAEFLFFTAHHAWPTTPGTTIRKLTQSLLEGYVEGGGSLADARKIVTPWHLKIFATFVLPGALYHLSLACRDFLKSTKS